MDTTFATKQSRIWEEEFGASYTDRNPQSIDDLDRLCMTDYGLTRRVMNEEFIGGLDRGITILEVGANLGLQLEMLRDMGFSQLIGIEINAYAVAQAKRLHPAVDILKGSAFALPFKDDFFDCVYTSGVLIHISPDDIPRAMDEMFRVTKRYIWGFEYYAPTLTEIPYRGNADMLWKTDFQAEYLKRFPSLKVVAERKYPMVGSKNVSQMYLLEK